MRGQDQKREDNNMQEQRGARENLPGARDTRSPGARALAAAAAESQGLWWRRLRNRKSAAEEVGRTGGMGGIPLPCKVAAKLPLRHFKISTLP